MPARSYSRFELAKGRRALHIFLDEHVEAIVAEDFERLARRPAHRVVINCCFHLGPASGREFNRLNKDLTHKLRDFGGKHCRGCGTMRPIVVPAPVTCTAVRGAFLRAEHVLTAQLNGRKSDAESILALTLASTLTLGACASNPQVAQDAAIGAAGGAAVGAVVPGVSVIEGAAVGAAIGGLAGAVWSDSNNDGYVDGYTYNGQYYAGTPQGYDPKPTASSRAQQRALSAAQRLAQLPARSSRASVFSRAR